MVFGLFFLMQTILVPAGFCFHLANAYDDPETGEVRLSSLCMEAFGCREFFSFNAVRGLTFGRKSHNAVVVCSTVRRTAEFRPCLELEVCFLFVCKKAQGALAYVSMSELLVVYAPSCFVKRLWTIRLWITGVVSRHGDWAASRI